MSLTADDKKWIKDEIETTIEPVIDFLQNHEERLQVLEEGVKELKIDMKEVKETLNSVHASQVRMERSFDAFFDLHQLNREKYDNHEIRITSIEERLLSLRM